MMTSRPWLAAWLLVLSGGVQADDPAGRSELALDLGVEHLSGNRSAWRSQSLQGLHRVRDTLTLTGGVMRTRRFNLNDLQVGGGAYWRATPTWSLSGLLWFSDTARVLPRWDATAQAMATIGGGVNAGAGWRRKLYRSDIDGHAATQGVNTLELLAEYYFPHHRLSWVGGLSRLDGGERAASQRLQLDRYYGNDSRLSLVVSAGREVERVGAAGLLRSSVRSVTVHGVHWLDAGWRDWAVQWEISTLRQGELYERTGARLGLHRRF